MHLGVGSGGASWGLGEVLPRVAVLWVVSVVGVWSREGLVSHKGRLVLLALLEDVHSPQTNQKEEQLNARVDETDNHGVLEDSILVDAIDDEGRLALDYIAEYITDFNKQLLKITNTREEDIALKAKLDVLRRLHGVLEVQGSDSAIAKMREQLDLATSEE